jgi:hypothetical protein
VTGGNLWTTCRSLDSGATWTAVDNGFTGEPSAIGADALGNIYVVGTGSNHWIVRKSSNGGSSWSTVDAFQYCVTTTSTRPPKTQTQCYSAAANGFAMDAYGNLFVVGYGASSSSSSSYTWIVRENPGGTGAWQTVDAFQATPGFRTIASAAAADALGHVYVAGFADDAAGAAHWIVRKR